MSRVDQIEMRDNMIHHAFENGAQRKTESQANRLNPSSLSSLMHLLMSLNKPVAKVYLATRTWFELLHYKTGPISPFNIGWCDSAGAHRANLLIPLKASHFLDSPATSSQPENAAKEFPSLSKLMQARVPQERSATVDLDGMACQLMIHQDTRSVERNLRPNALREVPKASCRWPQLQCVEKC